MSGFPRPPTRGALGPRYQNTKAVRNPQYQADADVFNLAFDTVAGSALMVARAWVLLTGSSGGVVLTANAESWNPDQETSAPFTPPAVARTSAGIYTVTYSASYPDSDGNDVPVGILATYGVPVSTANIQTVLASFTATTITVNLKQQPNGGGAWSLVDGSCLVFLI